MADNQDRVSALLQRTQEMRARAAIVLNFVPTSDDSHDDRWGDALVTSLARDVVALTEMLSDCDRLITAQNENLERLAGVSGSPDETPNEQLVSGLTAALERIAANTECSIGNRVVSKHDKFCAYHVALTALAGVGEHRPDQPQADGLADDGTPL